VIKIRENQTVINKAIFLALGISMDGHKDLLGLWICNDPPVSAQVTQLILVPQTSD